MKIVLTILISWILSSSYAQGIITNNEGRWCITKYDENKKLKEIIIVKDSITKNDSTQLEKYKNLIIKFENDSNYYTHIIRNDSIIFRRKDERIKKIEKDLSKAKLKTKSLSVLIIIIIIHNIAK